MSTLVCPECGGEVQYHQANCPSCHAFVGYPNIRRAEDIRAELHENYRKARAGAVANGLERLVEKLESICERSVATINVDPKLLAVMTLDQRYLNYYRSLERGLRTIAKETDHANRDAADAKVHIGYKDEIICAALSTDGCGLTNYGEIALTLRERSVERRASVLRENAYAFYTRFSLGPLNAVEPRGWRSVWSERAVLAVAHLAGELKPTTREDDLPDLVLHVGADRPADRYMEVHIYGDIRIEAVESVLLEKPLTNGEAQEDWAFARLKLARRSIVAREK
jgi:hypothetical protein